MNKKVPYKKHSVMWSYALLTKTRELAQYLVEKRKTIDFSKPAYSVERQYSDDIKQKILSISYSDWKKM
jgi:CRISPR-associated protein Cas1